MPPCADLDTICCRNPSCSERGTGAVECVVLAYTCGQHLYMIVQPGVRIEIVGHSIDLRCGCGWRTVWRRRTVRQAEPVAA